MSGKALKHSLLSLAAIFIFFSCLEGIQRIRHPEVGFRDMCNSLGFRSPEFDREKAPGIVRILFLGSSTTFGVTGSVEQTFPFQVGEILNENVPSIKIETINAAQPCKTSFWEVRRLEETLYLKPDILVDMTGYNDSVTIFNQFVDVKESGELTVNPPWYVTLDSWIAHYSVFYVTLREKISILRYGTPIYAFENPRQPGTAPKIDPNGWFEHYPRHFRDNLERIVNISATRKIKLVFIKAPLSPQRRRDGPLYERAYTRLMQELLSLCSERGIPVIDLEPYFSNPDWRDLISSDGLHFTAAGNRKIAEVISGYFLEKKDDYFGKT